ncbi:MAG: response regulator transcription factor [Gammaproteobacteria bacterium]|nr:response regulator transcription factor [Gammaproteobacteria bacterium]MDE2252065.1 response regulator transcription factor [Gammaproteobacteria bacterium]
MRSPDSKSPADPKCRLLLIDDHAILRMGLRTLLEIESDLEIVAEAGDAEEALELVARHKPDLVVSDLALPGRSGLELLSDLRRLHPDTRVVILTMHYTEEYVRVCLTRGALGYVLKDSNRVELLQAIRSVHQGRQFLCRAVSERVLDSFLRPGQSPDPERFVERPVTRRERDVLTRIASGQHNKKIAYDLGLSVATVHKHRQNIRRKLGVHNVAGMTAYAVLNGLLPSKPTG